MCKEIIKILIIECLGNLVKLLLHTDVTRYLEFKVVDGSYVFKDKKVNKVPNNAKEAFDSDLMSFWEKRRYDFLSS
jgi:Rab GDP dissociation inhibitor